MGSGSPGEVPEESTAEEDGAFETADANAVSLYKVTDASGKMQITPVASKPLRQETLDTRDCFILDTGSGIYVWVGRGATQKEKTDAMAKAQEFLRTKKYPAWTQIHRIVEGSESAPFKQYFATWRDAGMSHTRLIRSALGYDTDDSELDVDDVDAVVKNLKKSGGKAIGFMPDNGQNDIKEVIQFVAQPGSNDILRNEVPYNYDLPLLGFGAYIIPYHYESKNGETGNIIYVWEGINASAAVRERAFEDAMSLAVEMNAILVRTAQSHEPRHFLKMFKGKLMTLFDGTPIKPQLYRIRGTDASDVHATEVFADSSSLASSDVFALVRTENHKIYIWIGLVSQF